LQTKTEDNEHNTRTKDTQKQLHKNMSSARIELSSGTCCGSAGIDQTKPAILQPYLQDREWEKFCSEMDAALEPANTTKTISMGIFGVTFIIFLGVILSGFLSMGLEDTPIFVLPAVMMVVVFISFACYFCVMCAVKAKMQQICQSISHSHPQLSFHVRFERYRGGRNNSYTTQYIAVSINNTGNNVPNNNNNNNTGNNNNHNTEIPMAQADAICVADDSTTAHASSSAERLAELDKMKYSLTTGEFETKRAQILDSV
jgi:hypothetical protein